MVIEHAPVILDWININAPLIALGDAGTIVKNAARISGRRIRLREETKYHDTTLDDALEMALKEKSELEIVVVAYFPHHLKKSKRSRLIPTFY